ncbi:hypothetical protein HS088_TW18G01014 [Tripterygium wilfordii]|uniref:Pentatricopeptide repeat-containing protein n=1 Tax=Tripterygium wilfordii TaxID=458696 RepID=A0A7J7CE05_TRIWF|nr:pentatricopeptide repeat-containing protein At1g31430-like [Tripterygium wilfordii]KAF5732320.1 hypothetical protein HS088_TW18G01014 [Tripterygium wilfordii]
MDIPLSLKTKHIQLLSDLRSSPNSRAFLVLVMKVGRTVTRHLRTSTASLKAEQVTKARTRLDSIEELHAHLIRTQFHTDPSSISPVIKAYALSSYSLHKAQHAFHQIEQPNVLVFNHMIRGFSQSDQPNEAIRMYDQMYRQGLAVPDNLSIIFALKACGRAKDVLCCKKIHGHASKLGFARYLYVSNTLIHAYSFCDELSLARNVFDGMTDKDLVSWNSLICGYSCFNRYREVLGLFDAMQEAGVKADSVTMVKVILSCSFLDEWEIGDSMAKYIEDNHVDIDVYLGNSLIDMYGRRGLLDLAQNVFDRMRKKNLVSWNTMIISYAKAKNLVMARKHFHEMPQRDVISWTSMITGYSRANRFEDAVKLFREMMVAKVKPDEITVASVLSACAHLGTVNVGAAIHDYVRHHGVKADIYVGNALIDMYCKCGVVERALEVFYEMKEKDSVSWTSLITGLAVNGSANSAIDLFSHMLSKGFHPIHGTFVGILLACTHAGLVDEGLEYFESMTKVYGLTPEMKHYGCVVDLLSRAGNLDKAYEFINAMPITPNVVVWRILLSACKLHGNVDLAEIATNKLLKLDPSNNGNYVLLSNIYSSSDRWGDAKQIRELIQVSDVPNPAGWSSIELMITDDSRDTCVVQSEKRMQGTLI